MSGPPAIAIVGMACRYPEARSPAELWENVLAQRQAFRRIPPERLRAEDYWSADAAAPDRTYAVQAAVIEGYDFDRVRFRVAGGAFRAADLAHWLALDVAAQALADAGFPDGAGLPRDATGVLLGNTLTGEFSRAHVLRLRWPYVRRVVEARLAEEGWAPERRRALLERLEEEYKRPFPPVGEETLAGGLSNTIAGRICNHFDLKGGGYTVDGACAASLLTVATACSHLQAGDLDVALAGGVDLSLDPFELVGFAKAGALARDDMRVYDVRSAGFWPGEGCGFVVLMRQADAAARGLRTYALIRGWGVSSDGSGGITRPEVEGQLLALRRAYRRAGFGIETVTYIEGHGTGTAVGDAAELEVLSRARREAAGAAPPAAIGSIKANIGHTKAAAGVAGLLKATLALHRQILPPTTGCGDPHPILRGEHPALRVLPEGGLWPADRPLRAAVSAMGFGGINAHVVLEGAAGGRRTALDRRERALLASAQDAELFLLAAPSAESLRPQVDRLRAFAGRLSLAELADLAAELERRLDDGCRVRAALVASTPGELADRLGILAAWLAEGLAARLDPRAGVFLASAGAAPRVGFLFPGQGSPAHTDGGILRRRFETVRELYEEACLPTGGDTVSTLVAQPAIATASVAGLRVLDSLGVSARVAVGHSLGELTALHWAGALDEAALLRLARVRGRAMAGLGDPSGAMASIGAGRGEVEVLLDGLPAVIAGLNAPRQTVVSGKAAAVATLVGRARERGYPAVRLSVSHAFHSPLVAAAAPLLLEQFFREAFSPTRRMVVSTVTGARLDPEDDLRALLARQITSPVRFMEALGRAAEEADLFIEVGPGTVLTGLAAESVDVPAVALDAGGPSIRGLLLAAGAAFALGTPVKHAALFEGRATRPLDLEWSPRFFVNPCELAPLPPDGEGGVRGAGCGSTEQEMPGDAGAGLPPAQSEDLASQSAIRSPQSAIDVVRALVAERAELPAGAVGDAHRLLSDLHLNSIAVGQIVAAAARRLGLAPPVAPTEFADATLAQVARALEDLARTGGSGPQRAAEAAPPGVDSWVRPFTVELVDRPLRQSLPPHPLSRGETKKGSGEAPGGWQIIAPPQHPLVGPLREATARAGGAGVIVCLPPDPDEGHVELLLEGARPVLEGAAGGRAGRFVLVQHGGGGGGFARTLHLEHPGITTCVVDVPPDHPAAAEWVLAEAGGEARYGEAHYDASGRRREPVLRALLLAEPGQGLPLGPEDVLLVTGGGKGIAAECALGLARETGARLALLGRADPAADAELAANLERFAAAGVVHRYVRADVTDGGAVLRAVREAQAALGPVTAFLHGAGANVPQPLLALDAAAFRRTLLPKVRGLRNVLDAVDAGRLKFLVAFGSIIARTGMRGEADYAVANEWLARLTERWRAEHPHCRCLVVEWSVWSGAGMGERLGRVEALAREGITPIPVDAGVSILRDLMARPLPAISVVVAGRIGRPPTLQMEEPDLPFRRFLERVRVHVPGIELVADAELSAQADPYLPDHALRGAPLLPAVLGLEAMAQAAMALTGSETPPIFEGVRFSRPVTVDAKGSTTARVAALVREPGRVEVVLRSENTAFQVDHFRAACLFTEPHRSPTLPSPPGGDPLLPSPPGGEGTGEGEDSHPLVPSRDLYGPILFHAGRFRRLRAYPLLRARECLAEIAPDPGEAWFGRTLPPTLALGDPGARDAAIHAIQACIPHARILPVGVDRVVPGSLPGGIPLFVHARERRQDGDTFTYDLVLTTPDGSIVERWEGLHLRAVEPLDPPPQWAAPLLGPYLERRVRELIPGAGVSVAVVEHGAAADAPDGNGRPRDRRRDRGDRAMHLALGAAAAIRRRPDGKPEAPAGAAVSVAYAGPITLAVAGDGPVGCDVEPVGDRAPSAWQDLLGTQRARLAWTMARELEEEPGLAATRVWTAAESLRKAGAAPEAPLTFAAPGGNGWALLASGKLLIASVVARVRGVPGLAALAVLTGTPEVPCAPTNTGMWSGSKRQAWPATSTT